MPVEKKFDYGIAAGLGAEWSIRRIGHIILEARYYYGWAIYTAIVRKISLENLIIAI